jgi:hypothetical protein
MKSTLRIAVALVVPAAFLVSVPCYSATQQDVDAAVKAEVGRIDKDIAQGFTSEFKGDVMVKKLAKRLSWRGYTAPKPIVTFADQAGALAIAYTLQDFKAGAEKSGFGNKIDTAIEASIKKDLSTAGDPASQLRKLQRSRRNYDLDGKRLGRQLADQIMKMAQDAGTAAGRAVLDGHKNGSLPKTAPELTAWVKQTAQAEALKALKASGSATGGAPAVQASPAPCGDIDNPCDAKPGK